ncbi:hypothetical protein Pfo_009271 [Paulownia fortunei]|nr:hypothetical protein Pfo_009271 [Paulownia fortunei]
MEPKTFELGFDKKYKEKLLDSYLPIVLAREIQSHKGREKKVVKISEITTVNMMWPWGSVNFEHPSTSDILAMDPALKHGQMDDVNRYIIYVAEFANDTKLTDYYQNQLMLSGLLNFFDGLWLSCGEERIIVFTTNLTDTLDPALLRRGCMGVHIHMQDQKTDSLEVTPAEIAEELMKSEEMETPLEKVVKFLCKKKMNVLVQGEDKKEQEIIEKSDGGGEEADDMKSLI